MLRATVPAGLVVVFMAGCMPAAITGDSCEAEWPSKERGKTWFYNDRVHEHSWERWSMCLPPGSRWRLHASDDSAGAGSECRSFAARRDWVVKNKDEPERGNNVRWLASRIKLLDEYREARRRDKVHGTELMRWVCSER